MGADEKEERERVMWRVEVEVDGWMDGWMGVDGKEGLMKRKR